MRGGLRHHKQAGVLTCRQLPHSPSLLRCPDSVWELPCHDLKIKKYEKKKKKRVKIEFDTWGWKYLAMTCWVWLCWGRLYILQCSATTFLNPPCLALLGAPGWDCSKPEYSSWIQGRYSIRLCFFLSQTNFLGIKPQGHRTYIFWYPEQNII